MGLIAHLRNHFKSMNTFERSNDYICYKIGPVVLDEKIFIFRESSFAILLLSPNVKRCGLSIWTNLNPLSPRMLFCQVWLKLAQWFWRRRWNVKSLRQRKRQRQQRRRQTTDKFWSEKLTWAECSSELIKVHIWRFLVC